MSLINHLLAELNRNSSKYSESWSLSTEINLQAAILYLLARCLVLIEQENFNTQGFEIDSMICTLLQRGHCAALKLLKVMEDQGLQPVKSNTVPSIVTNPKQHFRVTFFACVFLIKYLDYPQSVSNEDIEAAHKAVSSIYELYNRLTSVSELVSTAKIIEVLGRTIIPGQGRIVNKVKTRMGASLTYNAIWTAAKLRGKEQDPDFSVTALRLNAGNESPSVADRTINKDHDFVEPSDDTFITSEQHFPWGVWDNDAFDAIWWNQWELETLSKR
jgi:hypothetical protein